MTAPIITKIIFIAVEELEEPTVRGLPKRLASRINLTKQTPGPAPVVPEASIGAISVIIHLFVWVHFKIPDILFF